VTACHRCNNKKADRTPEEAGMLLRNVPTRPVNPVVIPLLSRAGNAEIRAIWEQCLQDHCNFRAVQDEDASVIPFPLVETAA
jgi:hypothetical protein